MNEKLTVLDLFSGIGGFSLGLGRTGGFRTVAFCEIEPYCQAVLRKHWPDVPQFGDIRELKADDISADVITGGFPCQDLSIAGKQAGIDADRSGLWSELCRLIGEIRPRYAVVENVPRLLSGPSEQPGGWYGRVLGDMAEIGFDAEWHCIPASAVGAPHIRDRVWIIAYPQHPDAHRDGSHRAAEHNGRTQPRDQQSGHARSFREILADPLGLREPQPKRCQPNEWRWPSDGGEKMAYAARNSGAEQAASGTERERTRAGGQPKPMANNDCQRQPHDQRGPAPSQFNGFGAVSCSGWRSRRNGHWFIEPNVGRVAHGVPSRVDRLRALGNAVVPQVVEIIGNAILEAEGMK